MSAILWIEDSDEDLPRLTHNLFSIAFNGENLEFQSLRKTKSFLYTRQVFILRTFLDAYDVILRTNGLNDYDYVVLDIDLQVYDDDFSEDSITKLLELLSRWYGYNHTDFHEEDFIECCNALRPIAGYQLFICLVILKNFPIERVLFFSAHGDVLENLKGAFETAKIAIPKVYSKKEEDIPEVAKWIDEKYNNPYSMLRRNVINAISDIKRLIDVSDKSNIRFSQMHGSLITDYLETLPKVLPFSVNDFEDQDGVIGNFTRMLSQYWESVSYSDITGQVDKNEVCIKYFSQILKEIRNWTSHDDRARMNVNAQLASILFIINMRAMFIFPTKKTQEYEKRFLRSFGFNDGFPSMPRLASDLKKSWKLLLSKSKEIKVIKNDLRLCADCTLKNGEHITNNNGELLDNISLYFDNHMRVVLPATNMFGFPESIYQVLWHKLQHSTGKIPNKSEFVSNKTSYAESGDDYLYDVLTAIYPYTFN
ncbi:MAG: hypothetical protein ACKE9I_04390 [Methylophagaceae bacterium]